MTFKEKYGNTALVAGASEGMGAAYARALAARGLNLVLVARRKELLEQTAHDIATQYKVNVLPIACDLAAADATGQIIHALDGTTINFLIQCSVIVHRPLSFNTCSDACKYCCCKYASTACHAALFWR
jgi:short-subunit dehydrogenase